MSFRGGGRGGGRGFGRGGFGRGGGGRGFHREPEGPPEEVVEVGIFSHACEGEAVCKLTNEKVPYFNAPIFLENKTQVRPGPGRGRQRRCAAARCPRRPRRAWPCRAPPADR